jgi:hypothetical protein
LSKEYNGRRDEVRNTTERLCNDNRSTNKALVVKQVQGKVLVASRAMRQVGMNHCSPDFHYLTGLKKSGDVSTVRNDWQLQQQP